jgi:hypothetical protein
MIIATNNGNWTIAKKADVEGLSVGETVDRYSNNNFDKHKKQVILLSSWMPMNEDWSAIFREADVDEHILIGECDDVPSLWSMSRLFSIISVAAGSATKTFRRFRS